MGLYLRLNIPNPEIVPMNKNRLPWASVPAMQVFSFSITHIWLARIAVITYEGNDK